MFSLAQNCRVGITSSLSVKKKNIFLYNWIILIYNIFDTPFWLAFFGTKYLPYPYLCDTLKVICIISNYLNCLLPNASPIASSVILVFISSWQLMALRFSSCRYFVKSPTSCFLFSLFHKNASLFWYTMFPSENVMLYTSSFMLIILYCHLGLIFNKNNATVSMVSVYAFNIT